MDTGYWSKFAKSRVSRRRALAIAAGGVGGAALLAACGGDDDDGSTTTGATGGSTGGNGSSTGAAPPTGGTAPASTGGGPSGLLTTPTDSTSVAVRGGILAESATSDAFTWDANLNGPGLHGPAGLVYSRLVKYATGTLNGLPDGTVEPDFASSFEISADGLQVTFKIREGLKWDGRAPTSGRVADSEDVAYSWQRWAERNPRRAELSNAINPEAPVESVSTPDKSTAIFKLAFPYAPLLPLLGFSFHPLVYPQEAEGGFDPRADARGTGAWMLEKHEPSVSIEVKRNPDWYLQDRPYLEGRKITIIPDYAQGLSQFNSGSLDVFNVNQQDILATKQQTRDLVLTQRPTFSKNTGGWIYFGLREGSPFVDDRVRRAMSMEIDRDTWLDTFSNRAAFESAGLPVETAWTNFVGPGFPFHLDPRGDEIGDGGKNFLYDPAEAKKLLAAAGVDSPIESPWSMSTLGGPAALEAPEAIRGLIELSGDFKLEPVNVLDYFTEFIPKVETVHGDFDGVAYQPYAEPPDYDFTMFVTHHPSATDFWMKEEDPKITEFVIRQRQELDADKRAEILKDFQRYAATKMYYIPAPPGDWKPFSLHQPWLMNRGHHVGWISSAIGYLNSQEIDTYLWLDESKR